MRPDRSFLGLELGAGGRAVRCAFAALLTAAIVSGCSGAGGVVPVDAALARDALRIALDGWKKGDAPAALREGSPSIVVQDLDWLAGARLVEYQVRGPGKAIETNLHIPVKLTLQTRNKKSVTRRVSYVVSTSPYVGVFRALR